MAQETEWSKSVRTKKKHTKQTQRKTAAKTEKNHTREIVHSKGMHINCKCRNIKTL